MKSLDCQGPDAQAAKQAKEDRLHVDGPPIDMIAPMAWWCRFPWMKTMQLRLVRVVLLLEKEEDRLHVVLKAKEEDRLHVVLKVKVKDRPHVVLKEKEKDRLHVVLKAKAAQVKAKEDHLHVVVRLHGFGMLA